MYSCLSYIDPPLRVTLLLANQEQVRGSCVSFESLGAVGSSSGRLCVSFSRAWEPLDQAVRGSCVSFECLEPLDQAVRRSCVSFECLEPLDQAVRGSCVSFESLEPLDQAVRGLNIYIKFIHCSHKTSIETNVQLSN